MAELGENGEPAKGGPNGQQGGGPLVPPKRCRHCGELLLRKYSPRMLCLRHYNDLEIRVLYPSLGREDGYGARGPSKAFRHWIPTVELPGTDGKITVMSERAMRGVPIFHPDDAQNDGTVISVAAGFLVMMPRKRVRNTRCSVAGEGAK